MPRTFTPTVHTKSASKDTHSLVVSATDFGGHFHLLGLMLATNETSDDFKSMFNALKDVVAKVYQKDVVPDALISDSAGAIHIGFKETFGEELKIIMCWFHVIQNFNKRKLNDTANHDSMRDDLRKLKLSYNDKVFAIGSRLFLEKWKGRKVEFVAYFEETYIKRNGNW